MEEVPTRIEPCYMGDELPADIAELTRLIVDVSGEIGVGLGVATARDLRALVTLANAHHSNRIEGYRADPIIVARFLSSHTPEADLNDEAAAAIAHVRAQREIESRLDRDHMSMPTDIEFVRAIHETLYVAMPETLAKVDGPCGVMSKVIPGRLRQEGDHDIVVGRHQPPSSARVHAFVAHFAKRYRQVGASLTNRIAAIPAAHHRLSFIHPFPDGNGRVARLMSQGMARAVGIEAGGLWSISRALANGMGDTAAYLRMMDYADHPRMGALDGRGNLSRKALIEFSRWFLECVAAEMRFTADLFSGEAVTRRMGSTTGRIGLELGVSKFSELFHDPRTD
jgi:Fic family protein